MPVFGIEFVTTATFKSTCTPILKQIPIPTSLSKVLLLLDAILQVFPLDTYVEKPVSLMEVMKGDNAKTPIWDTYKEIIAKHDNRGADTVGTIERFAFYEEAKKAYAIIHTGETRKYGNIILQKGVIPC